MSHSLKLFVVDTGPLITLAVAQSLDDLLYIDADVVIPDAVLHEATYDVGQRDVLHPASRNSWGKTRQRVTPSRPC